METIRIVLARLDTAGVVSSRRAPAGGTQSSRRRPERSLVVQALVGVVAAFGTSAHAQFPERDIAIVIPFNSGGGFDSYVRALVPWLERHLPNEVNVLPRNVPGAGGRRGTNEVFRAAPDGYTIGAFNLPGVLIPQLQDVAVGYDLARITWLCTLGEDPYVYAVAADSPLRSIAQIVAARRQMLYGATGPGSTSYVATAIVNEQLGIPYEIVTGYTGSSAYLVGLLRGDVEAALVNLSAARPYVESGDIRILAMFGAESEDPAVPDAADLGLPGLGQLKLVRMLGAPPGLPEDRLRALESGLLAALADPGFEAWLASTGNEVAPADAAATAATVTDMARFYEAFKTSLD